MTTEYRVVDFQFDASKWAIHITAVSEQVGEKELAAMLGITVSGLRHWANNSYPMGFHYPSMTNFLLACNLMDADPRQFFILGE